MSLFGPFDPLLAVLCVAFKVRPLRAVILFIGLIPAVLYALPAQSCSCIRPPFVRCTSGGREMAYRAAMKSDLKNIASQEEIYLSDHDAFSADPTALQIVSSTGVNVTLVATPGGWAARATHEALAEQEACALAFGDEVAHGFEVLEDAAPGQLVCTF